MAPNLNFGFMTYIVINWVVMTHSSVMLVSKKLSCTYMKDSTSVWRRLLWINILMFPLSIFTCIYWTVSWNFPGHSTLEHINSIMEPIQIALWGLIEFCLSGMFIVRLWHYHWNVVERLGILVLVIVACCDVSTVLLNLFLGDLESTCVKGFVYCLRIRLEISVLNAMVDSVRKKQYSSAFATGVAAVHGSGDKMDPNIVAFEEESVSPFDDMDTIDDDVEQGRNHIHQHEHSHNHCHKHRHRQQPISSISEEPSSYTSPGPTKNTLRGRASFSSITLTTDVEIMPTLYEDCCELCHPSMLASSSPETPDSAPKAPLRLSNDTEYETPDTKIAPDSAPKAPLRLHNDTEYETLVEHEHDYEFADCENHPHHQRAHENENDRHDREEIASRALDTSDKTASSSTDQMNNTTGVVDVDAMPPLYGAYDVDANVDDAGKNYCTTFQLALPPLPDVQPVSLDHHLGCHEPRDSKVPATLDHQDSCGRQHKHASLRASTGSKDSCDCMPSKPNRYDSESDFDFDLVDDYSELTGNSASSRHSHDPCCVHQPTPTNPSRLSPRQPQASPKSVSSALSCSVPPALRLNTQHRRASLQSFVSTDYAPFKPQRFESGAALEDDTERNDDEDDDTGHKDDDGLMEGYLEEFTV